MSAKFRNFKYSWLVSTCCITAFTSRFEKVQLSKRSLCHFYVEIWVFLKQSWAFLWRWLIHLCYYRALAWINCFIIKSLESIMRSHFCAVWQVIGYLVLKFRSSMIIAFSGSMSTRYCPRLCFFIDQGQVGTFLAHRGWRFDGSLTRILSDYFLLRANLCSNCGEMISLVILILRTSSAIGAGQALASVFWDSRLS